MIPEHFIQELLNRIDIVDVIDAAVPLKKAGANHVACCPFHNEKSPSFTVSPSKQFYHCFGCGAHGTAIGFLMEYQGLTFVEAIEDLAQKVGVKVPQEERTGERNTPKTERPAPSMFDVMQQAAAYYRAELKKSKVAITYLKGRGLSGEIAARFQMGYAPEGWQNLREVFPQYEQEALSTLGLTIKNDEGRVYDRFRERVMFPIHDQRGNVIGFGGRVMGSDKNDGPKYLNSPETPLFQKGQELYGLFLARQAIRAANKVVVVEGYMDVVALAQHGVEYAVATLGTATTPQHITKLMRQTDDIVFCFDGDAAGKKAAWRAAMNALPALNDGIKLSFLFLPSEHDPDSYVREFGREKFELELADAMPLSAYIVQELSVRNELDSHEGRARFMDDAKPILQQLQAPKLNLMLRKRVAELAGVTQAEVESLLKLQAPTNRPKAQAKAPRRAPTTLTRKLLQLLLIKPELALQLDAERLPNNNAEFEALVRIMQLVATDRLIRSAAIVENLKGVVVPQLLADLTGELLRWEEDEEFDLAEEFAGVLSQLQAAESKQSMSALLAKPFAALTAEEKELLRGYRQVPVSENK
ncbi:MAG: DNA primase [Methylophilaceae bacterium]